MRIKKTKLSYVIEIPKISDDAYLCFAEGSRDIPFSIKRVYYIFDAKTNAPRGFHAHKKTQQVIFCIKGKIRMVLDNGFKKEEIIMNQPNKGVFLDRMIWHEMLDFDEGTILLVFASGYFKEKDYIRSYDYFLKLCGREKVKSLKDVPKRPVLEKVIDSIGV